jgi:hypothetical protein
MSLGPEEASMPVVHLLALEESYWVASEWRDHVLGWGLTQYDVAEVAAEVPSTARALVETLRALADEGGQGVVVYVPRCRSVASAQAALRWCTDELEA